MEADGPNAAFEDNSKYPFCTFIFFVSLYDEIKTCVMSGAAVAFFN